MVAGVGSTTPKFNNLSGSDLSRPDPHALLPHPISFLPPPLVLQLENKITDVSRGLTNPKLGGIDSVKGTTKLLESSGNVAVLLG